MPFTEPEIAEHAQMIENLSWSRRRPPLHRRDKIREGQRIEGLTITLFFQPAGLQRSASMDRGADRALEILAHAQGMEDLLAAGRPEVAQLQAAAGTTPIGGLPAVVSEDEYGCFFG